jgi:hypothetical protein
VVHGALVEGVEGPGGLLVRAAINIATQASSILTQIMNFDQLETTGRQQG